jgi:restriction endonuclease S subunit
MGQPHVYPKDIKKIKIPLPPLSVQQEIVAELESYQKIIDGAKQVVENYKPRIDIDPSWQLVKLGEVISLEYGKPLKKEHRIKGEYPVFGSNGIVGWHKEYFVKGPFVIVGRKGTAGAVTYSEKSGYPIDTTFYIQIINKKNLALKFAYYQLSVMNLEKVNTQSGVPGLNRNDAYKKLFPLPPIETQKEIVAKIKDEQELVNSNKKLIKIYEEKIESRISKVWGS